MNTDSERDLREYLKMVASLPTGPKGAAYRNYEHLVLELGRDYTPAPRPRGVRKGRNGLCFANALRLVMNDHLFGDQGLTYVEGFGVPEGSPIPILHGWAVTPEGVVIDPTWAHPERAVYRGIPLDYSDVARLISRRRRHGILANDYLDGCPLLMTGKAIAEEVPA